jgi:transposase
MRKSQQQEPLNDLSRSLTPFDPYETLIGVVELSKGSWLVAGIIPGVERQPLKKLAPDEDGLLKLLERWRAEAENAGHKITRIAVAFETGRDGFWLARWLRGERDHCKMAAIPTFAEEDAKRPYRERENLVGEHTSIISRIKSTLARLGIRGFNPTLKEAPERLEHLRTPEGEPIPPNTLAELKRDMER